MVRFATLCDFVGCGRRSQEYTEWPSCRTCQLAACPDHQEPGTLVQDSERNDCECRACASMFATAAPGDFQ